MDTKKEEINGYYGKYYTAKSLDVWQHLEDEDLNALEIKLKGDKKITFQAQFENYYKNSILRNQDIEWCETNFFLIFDQNKLIIEQIKKYKEHIELLSNPDNWESNTLLYSLNIANSTADSNMTQGGFITTKNNAQDGGKDVTYIDNVAYIAANAAGTDNNSQYEDVKDYEDQPKIPKEAPNVPANGESEEPAVKKETVKKSKIPGNPLEITILANQLSQNRSLNVAEKELTLKKGTSSEAKSDTSSSSSSISVSTADRKNVMVGKNVSTNKFQERMEFLKSEIPTLRINLITKFSPLFII